MTASAFLAFEAADEGVARHVAAELDRQGWITATCTEELRPADRHASLVQIISDAAVFVLIASPAADASVPLRRQVAAALSNGRPLLVAQAGELPSGSWIHATADAADIIDLRAGPASESLSRLAEAARNAGRGGRVIAMLNMKGGVGKTVLGANLFAAAHLADQRSVCFVDLDPQHNLTQYFLSSAERAQLRDRNQTIYSVLAPGEAERAAKTNLEALPVPLNRARREKTAAFDLVAGDERLFEWTLDTRPEEARAIAFARFRQLIAFLRARVDAVVIDSNPCATFLTRLAVSAADHIVAPVRPEKYSLSGLNMLEHVVREIRGRPLRPAEFSVLLNGVKDRARSSESGDVDALTRNEISAAPFFSGALLSEEIPHSAALRSGPSDRIVSNPINVTAMMRVGGRPAKEALTAAAAAILRRAAS